jgi:hypothetical protein
LSVRSDGSRPGSALKGHQRFRAEDLRFRDRTGSFRCTGLESEPAVETTGVSRREGSVEMRLLRWILLLPVTLLAGIASVSVPAFADQIAARDISSPSQPVATTLPVTIRSVKNGMPLLQQGLIERSIAVEGRLFAASAGAQTNRNRQTVHQRNWAGRHPVLLGTVIGFGFGVGDQAIQCVTDPGTRFFPWDPGGAAGVGGIFAGIGAGVGAVVALFLR